MVDNDKLAVLEAGFSFWGNLTEQEKKEVEENAVEVRFRRGESIHRAGEDCAGMMLVTSGQLRTYILSEDGRAVTLYRLWKGDVCVLSASCVLSEVAFDVLIEAVVDTEVILLPLAFFRRLKEKNVYVELFTYRLATERFSDVMWSLQQILFMRADQRLAAFLWDEMTRTGTEEMSYTHDQIARYMGSAREVVSRLLKYFSQEGIVKVSRGKITVLDRAKLKSFL